MEYMFILIMMILVTGLVVAGWHYQQKLRRPKINVDPNVDIRSIPCPRCGKDLLGIIEARTRDSNRPEIRIKCPQCQTGSGWNVTAFPPIMISVDSAPTEEKKPEKSDGDKKEEKKK